jgi:hypothetical protein
MATCLTRTRRRRRRRRRRSRSEVLFNAKASVVVA